MTSILKLTVVTYAGQPRPGLSKQFETGRATVGRGADNDWMLPDPEKHLSSRHCVIERRDNRYIITDVSKNGVFLNSAEYALGNGSFADLANGDLITIGDYQLRVEIEGDLDQSVPAGAGFGGLDPFPRQVNFDRVESPFGVRRDPLSPQSPLPGSEPLSPLSEPSAIFPIGGKSSPLIDPPNTGPFGQPAPDHVPAMGTFFRAPEVKAPIIPPDWNPLAPTPDELPAPATGAPAVQEASPLMPELRAAPRAPARMPILREGEASLAGSAVPLHLLRAFLEGAGLSNAEIDGQDATERMRNYGQIFRELVFGIRELLAVRTLTKSEFHLEQTVIRANDNNPLKFSVDLDQALSALLLPQRSGYAEPLPAARQAIADLKAHELSLIAGMQKSVAKLLAALSPEEVERHVEAAGLLASLLPAARKARYWEAYETIYRQVAEEFNEDVQSGFRQAFADAYFDQVKKL
jgi:type VI secretion system protein